MLTRVLMIACVVLTTPAMAEQLTGEQRTEMVKIAKGTCLDNNVKKPENRAYTLGVVDAFCTCVGNSSVDSFSIAELEAAATGLTPDFIKRRAAFTNKCADGTLRKFKR
jgi:hypothetical protein